MKLFGRRRLVSSKGLRADGTRSEFDIPEPAPMTGDLEIFVRPPDGDDYLPFNGESLGGEAMRWPFYMRQHVLSIAGALRDGNPGYDVVVRREKDTAYEDFDGDEYLRSYRKDIKGIDLGRPAKAKKAERQADLFGFMRREPEPVQIVSALDFPYDGSPMPVDYDDFGVDFEDDTELDRWLADRIALDFPYDGSPLEPSGDPYDDPLYDPELQVADVRAVKAAATPQAPARRAEPVPELGGFVTADTLARQKPKAAKKASKKPREISAAPMDTYSTQTYGVLVETEPVKGRLTPNNKANAIGMAIVEMTEGRSVPIKDTIRKGTYYAVLRVDAPEIGDTRNVLVSGRVRDIGGGRLQVMLDQSDTGSANMDVPKSYMELLDFPQTEQDKAFRQRMAERYDGDGRPWEDRAYTVGLKKIGIGDAVGRIAKSTGRSEKEVLADPMLRGMRVHDIYDLGDGETMARSYSRRGRR